MTAANKIKTWFGGLFRLYLFLACAQSHLVFATNGFDGHQESIDQAFATSITHAATLRVDLRWDLFTFPLLRWTLSNVETVAPMAVIPRGRGPIASLHQQLKENIERISFRVADSDKIMTIVDALNETHTDGIVIMHDGDIVYEKYSRVLGPAQRHLACSVTKSFVGLVGAILVHQRILNENSFVRDYVSELSDSAFGDATIRQLLDMQVSLDYSENYADGNADVWKYMTAANMLPRPKDYAGPTTILGYLKGMKKNTEEPHHGRGFRYQTPITDVLAIVIEAATKKTFVQALSEMIWQRVGAENNAMITVDSEGRAFAGAGLGTTLRDLARFGEMMRLNGKYLGMQVVPKAVIDDIKSNADQNAFKTSGFNFLAGWAYRNMWWVKDKRGIFTARGTFGQTIYVDQPNKIVIVKYGSTKSASNLETDPILQPAFETLARSLNQISSRL